MSYCRVLLGRPSRRYQPMVVAAGVQAGGLSSGSGCGKTTLRWTPARYEYSVIVETDGIHYSYDSTSSITAIQICEAHDRGVLVPWNS